MNNLKEILKKTKIFEGLSDRIINLLAEGITVLEYDKNDTIIWKGEESTDLYIILQGKINILTFDENGNELIIDTLGKGDFVGELSLIDGKPRSMSAQALTNVKVAVLPRRKFLSILEENPPLCKKMMEILVERLRRTDEKLETLVFLDVKRRIIKFIKENAVEVNGDIYKINKMSHSEIAKRIGSSREAVTKAMNYFIKNKIISEGKRFIVLKNSSMFED